MEVLDLSNHCKVGRKMTGRTRSFTIVSLARIRGVPTRLSRRGRHCAILTQDLSTAFSSRPFNAILTVTNRFTRPKYSRYTQYRSVRFWRVPPCRFEHFLHYFDVSECKIEQNMCAEGALIVKRPFLGSKLL